LDASEIAAIQSGAVIARDFVWIEAKERITGEPANSGYWTGAGNVTASVVDGKSGSTVSRVFYGMEELIGISSIPLTSDLAVRRVEITLSQIAATVEQLVRGYDVRNAPIQIYRGYFS